MKTHPDIISLLLAALCGFALTACQSNTVYFGKIPRDLQKVSVKGGTPSVLIPELTPVMGLACTKDGKKLYAARQSSIDVWGTDGSSQGVLIQTGTANCVALDEKAGRVYWGDNDRKHVASCDLQGGNVRVLASGMKYPAGVAVNPSKAVVYWVQEYPDGGVWMSQTDGSGKRQIYAENSVPKAVAVDRPSGRIFWATVGAPAHVMTANWDGSEPKVVVDGLPVYVEGLAVDERSRRIIWTERHSNGEPPRRIRSACFDGSGAKTLCEFKPDEGAHSLAVGPAQK